MRIFSVLFLCCGLYAQQKVGKYEVTLRLPEEGLFAVEEMQIEFRIVDTSRVDPVMGAAPVVRASVESEIDMPVMPGMPKIIETAHPEGVPGEYGIHPTFVHGGPYRLKLRVVPPGDETFGVEFPLEVGDARKTKAKPPYWLEVSGPANDLTLKVIGPGGIVTAFDEVHERKMHLIAVRKDLGAFVHLHPDLSPDGTFHLKHQWAAGGDYSLFADVAPKGKGSQILPAKIKVAGPKESRPWPDAGLKFEVDGSWPVKKTGPVIVKISPTVELEPYLGAMGHLMIVSADAQNLVHSHPVAYKPGEIAFLARLPQSGKYRAWLEVQRDGKILTKQFDVEAQ